ncbi:MAG: hypothetical protein KGQ52_13090 [Alphaproteobacteria bacterium]|nr:hypothetical protein [Alphaproteobacteria bacterium]
MSYHSFHAEDVKAAIRKRFGSLAKFEMEHGFPPKSVSAVLRGATSARIGAALDAVMVLERATVLLKSSEFSGSTAMRRGAHRLNREAA